MCVMRLLLGDSFQCNVKRCFFFSFQERWGLQGVMSSVSGRVQVGMPIWRDGNQERLTVLKVSVRYLFPFSTRKRLAGEPRKPLTAPGASAAVSSQGRRPWI